MDKDAILRELKELKAKLDKVGAGPGYPPPRRDQTEIVYKDLIDSMRDVVYTTTVDGTITSLNPVFEEFTGWSVAEWIGKNFRDLFHPDDVPEAKATFQRLLKGEKTRISRWRVRTKAGGYLTGEFHSTLYVKGGKIVGIIGIARNVTPYEETEKALKESELKYQDLVEKAGIAILIDDAEGNFRYFNKKFLEIFGYSEEEMKQQSIRTLVHPEDLDMVLALHKNRIAGREVKSRYEFRGLRRGGKVVYLEVDAVPIREGDRIIGTRSYIWDITERKMAEEEIRKARERLKDEVVERTAELRREIAERIKTENQLKREREFLRRLTDTSPIGIVVMDPGLRKITFANQPAIKLLRLRKDEKTGIYEEPDWTRTYYDGRPFPDDKIALAQVIETKTPVHDLRYSIHFSDGETIYLSINAAPLFDQEGKLEGVVATIHDVTQQYLADQALKASEAKYKTLTENLNVGIYRYELGSSNRFVEVNPAIVTMFGYENREEFLSVDAKTLYRDPEDKLRFETKLGKEGHVRNEIIQFRRKDGTNFFGSVSAVAVRDEDGKILYYDGIIEDITERIQAEKELALQRLYFQRLFEESPEAIVMLDNQDRVMLVNKAFQTIFQYTPEEAKGRYINDLIVPDHLTGEASGLSQKVLSGNVIEKETVRKRKDGSLVDVSILGYPIVVDDKLIGVYGIYLDISKRKRAEKELKESYEKLRKILDGTVSALASTTEKRDPYTAGHQYRVTSLACAIAQKMGLSEDRIDGIRVAGMLHDIGKIYIAAEILNKPIKLNEIEMRLVKEHCRAGYEILKNIDFSWPVAEIVYQHHERLDGSGYPRGLKGDEIMLEARILAVADVVEAMTSHRPYRGPLDLNDALQEIVRNRGILYDAEVVDACLELIQKDKFNFEEVSEGT
ncbi:hypothetical protein DRP53_01735 [candidate division WOR-3 bacterium]|uniref:PAS domain S-box protein n=1 Tax=candidate division WOR-3 bacterium TaxID=2052148 RepID=A0A660SLK0_UNCW3|nr:MAG: hypothetical protein DRP53_01735 [candidate division WOR-3 bacterium]